MSLMMVPPPYAEIPQTLTSACRSSRGLLSTLCCKELRRTFPA